MYSMVMGKLISHDHSAANTKGDCVAGQWPRPEHLPG